MGIPDHNALPSEQFIPNQLFILKAFYIQIISLLLGGLLSAQPTFERDSALRVFGDDLFQGQFSRETFTGFNPDYQLSIGDQVNLQLWGTQKFSETLTIDTQGNLFIPEVGPLKVEGMRNADLISALKQKVSEKFRNNVEIYANLTTRQPVKVFVGGNVRYPGLYSGHSGDSLLYFVDRAGGIDAQSGSYLNVTHKRNGDVLREVNLYDFLLKGDLPTRQFADGDVLFVNRRSHVVSITGAVHKSYQFEFIENPIPGTAILEVAHPLPNSTHILVRSEKGGESDSTYVALPDIANHQFSPGDKVTFISESLPKSIEIQVSGEHLGAARLILPYPATLSDALKLLEPGPLANEAAIGIFRRSVAKRQKSMLQESLDSLERKILTARSSTAEETEIRANEAEMLLKFIDRARDTQPKGQIILSNKDDQTKIYLEDGDTLHIPKVSNLILVHGEVVYPNAQVHNSRTSLESYIENAGGFADNADTKSILVVHPDGSIHIVGKTGKRLPNSSLGQFRVLGLQSKVHTYQSGIRTKLQAGDEVLVLPKANVKSLQVSKDITQILYQIAIAARVVLDL